MDDLPLHHLAKWRTEQGFRAIYRHYAPYVWRVAFRTSNGSTRIATEITQSVFVQALKGLPKFRFDSAFSSWLYRITYHESMRLLKRESSLRNKHLVADEQLEDYAAWQQESEQQQDLAKLLAALTPEERFLLVSREVEGLTFDELATLTGKNSGALRTQLSRIKQRLQGEEYEK